MARLPRLIGRGRALEVLLAADDINAELAELYGYVNRALPDAELDGFVDAMAMRIASFDNLAVSKTVSASMVARSAAESAGERINHSEPAGPPFSATDRFMNNTANVTTNVNTAAIQKTSKKASEDACC